MKSADPVGPGPQSCEGRARRAPSHPSAGRTREAAAHRPPADPPHAHRRAVGWAGAFLATAHLARGGPDAAARARRPITPSHADVPCMQVCAPMSKHQKKLSIGNEHNVLGFITGGVIPNFPKCGRLL